MMTLMDSLGSSGLVTGLATAAVRALLLAAVAGLALALFRVKSTAARLFTWTMVLYAALMMPVLGRILPPVAVPMPAFVNAGQTAQVEEASLPEATVATARVVQRVPNARKTRSAAPALAAMEALPAEGPAATPFPWQTVVFCVYVAGAAALLVRVAVGILFSRRLLKGSPLIQDSRVTRSLAFGASACGVNSLPRVGESECISVPVTMGALHPTILLPAEWQQWNDEKLEAVIAHEMSHVARGDALTHQLSVLHRAIFWFSPLAWWLERHLASLAEQASDEAVLAAGADRNGYARMLLGFFEALHAAPGRVWWEGVAMAKGGQAEQRLERILAWKGSVAMNLKKPVVLAMVALAIPTIYFAASVQAAHAGQESQRTVSTPVPAAPVRGVVAPAALAPGAAVVSARALAGTVAPRALWAQARGMTASRAYSTGNGYSYAYGFGDDQTYAIISGNSSSITMSGMGMEAEHMERLKKRIPGDFIWFERDDKGYVIRDQATIERAKKLFAPQDELGKQQDDLGKQQDAIGKQQDDLGKKMEQVRVTVPDLTADLDKLRDKLKQLKGGATQDEVGDLQSQIGDLQEKMGAIQSQAGDEQEKIGRQMEGLGRQMEKLGEQQERLGRQQEELCRKADREMKSLLDEAIKNGTAKPEPEVDNPTSL